MTLATSWQDDPDWTIENAIAAGVVDEACATDPWGTPFQMTRNEDGSVVFSSAGDDLLFGTGDDFRSDMARQPVAPQTRIRNRQLLLALAATFSAWLAIFWSIRRLSTLNSADSADESRTG